MTGIVLAVSSAIFLIFIGFPLFTLQPSGQAGSPLESQPQSAQEINNVSNEINSCIASPSANCDQEMQQISLFCGQNPGQEQNYPFCSDPRVQMYLQHRNMDQIRVNGGQG